MIGPQERRFCWDAIVFDDAVSAISKEVDEDFLVTHVKSLSLLRSRQLERASGAMSWKVPASDRFQDEYWASPMRIGVYW